MFLMVELQKLLIIQKNYKMYNIENDTIINCMNSLCDKHNTICKNCNNLVNGCCSEKCKNSGKMRKKKHDYYNIMSSNKNLMLK